MMGEDIMDYTDRCRLCIAGAKRLSIDIFSPEGKRSKLQAKISKYLSLKISEDDKLPSSICYQCLFRLETWVSFKKHCLDSDQTLKNWAFFCGAITPESYLNEANKSSENGSDIEKPGSSYFSSKNNDSRTPPPGKTTAPGSSLTPRRASSPSPTALHSSSSSSSSQRRGSETGDKTSGKVHAMSPLNGVTRDGALRTSKSNRRKVLRPSKAFTTGREDEQQVSAASRKESPKQSSTTLPLQFKRKRGRPSKAWLKERAEAIQKLKEAAETQQQLISPEPKKKRRVFRDDREDKDLQELRELRELRAAELKEIRAAELKEIRAAELKERRAAELRELRAAELRATELKELRAAELRAAQLRAGEVKELRAAQLRAGEVKELRAAQLRAGEVKELRAAELRAGEVKELRTPELRAEDLKELRTAELRAGDLKELRTAELRAGEVKEFRAMDQLHEVKELREAKEARDVEMEEVKELRVTVVKEELKEVDVREAEEIRETKELREAKELREVKDIKEAKDLRDAKELRDVKVFVEANEFKEGKEFRERKETKESKSSKSKNVTEMIELDDPDFGSMMFTLSVIDSSAVPSSEKTMVYPESSTSVSSGRLSSDSCFKEEFSGFSNPNTESKRIVEENTSLKVVQDSTLGSLSESGVSEASGMPSSPQRSERKRCHSAIENSSLEESDGKMKKSQGASSLESLKEDDVTPVAVRTSSCPSPLPDEFKTDDDLSIGAGEQVTSNEPFLSESYDAESKDYMAGSDESDSDTAAPPMSPLSPARINFDVIELRETRDNDRADDFEY